VTELTHLSFPDFLRTNRFVLLHFYASWNGYDVKMKELLEHHIPAELSGLVAIGKMDVDPVEHHDICRQHKLINLPSLALYRDGALIQTVTGMRRSDEIAEYLRELISG
jgi:thioredoxin 1